MIYRIHSDKNYLVHQIPPIEALSKLDEEHGKICCSFSPKEYLTGWVPINIEFNAHTRKAIHMPDVSLDYGRLFLNEKAYQQFNGLIGHCGEFLPVSYSLGTGYIFNPLKTAEDSEAIDNALLSHDQHGNITNYGFYEHQIIESKNIIFKTALDSYLGNYCLDTFKEAFDHSGLKGLVFNSDISNPINEAYELSQ